MKYFLIRQEQLAYQSLLYAKLSLIAFCLFAKQTKRLSVLLNSLLYKQFIPC